MAGRNGNRESTVKGLSTEKKNQRPTCPGCGAPNPVSRGVVWLCKSCGRNFQKIWRGKTRQNLNRPKQCPHCGTASEINGELRIWLNGHRWWCRACGKMWGIHTGTFSHRKDLGERPNCPACGASNPKSSGINWVCKCGKHWVKNYRLPFVLHNELVSAKVITA